MAIIWIIFFCVYLLIPAGYLQDVSFEYDQSCYSVGDSLTMTAIYSGSGTVTAVQWYYSGQTSTNLIVLASACTVFGAIPPGYPDASRMSYECTTTDSLPANSFKFTLTGLQEDELNRSWGATFYLSALSPPDIVLADITICRYLQDVSFEYDQSCYSVGDSLTMTAVYSGSGTVTAVQWYYSGKTSNNLIVLASACTVLGAIPPGYPDASRMSYECTTTDSLPANSFKLTLTGLQEDELNRSWGATFYLSAWSPPDIVLADITICNGFSARSVSTLTTTKTKTSKSVAFSGSTTLNKLSAGTVIFSFPIVFSTIVLIVLR